MSNLNCTSCGWAGPESEVEYKAQPEDEEGRTFLKAYCPKCHKPDTMYWDEQIAKQKERQKQKERDAWIDVQMAKEKEVA